jgi:hypothetical protein
MGGVDQGTSNPSLVVGKYKMQLSHKDTRVYELQQQDKSIDGMASSIESGNNWNKIFGYLAR